MQYIDCYGQTIRFWVVKERNQTGEKNFAEWNASFEKIDQSVFDDMNCSANKFFHGRLENIANEAQKIVENGGWGINEDLFTPEEMNCIDALRIDAAAEAGVLVQGKIDVKETARFNRWMIDNLSKIRELEVFLNQKY